MGEAVSPRDHRYLLSGSHLPPDLATAPSTHRETVRSFPWPNWEGGKTSKEEEMHCLSQSMAWDHTAGALVPGFGEKLNFFFFLNGLNDQWVMHILHKFPLMFFKKKPKQTKTNCSTIVLP